MEVDFKSQKRLWSYIDFTDLSSCWNWTGNHDKDGYGKIKINKKTYRPHRLLYQLYNSVILTPTEFVCHKCDNPACVNPYHMFVGSCRDNAYDMVKKGRELSGIKSPNAKLNDEKIIKIFDLFINQHKNPSEICGLFGVSETLIRTILKRKAWDHIIIPYIDDNYNFYEISKDNVKIRPEKRQSFRERMKMDPYLLDKIVKMMETHNYTDICNFFDINQRTLTRLLKKIKSK